MAGGQSFQGRPDESELVKRITSEDELMRMLLYLRLTG
ncbi:MAG: hypothetical protein IPJ07_09745 [Acidobacteria bacterium]|nr:hypothetical protein [Acidobacteriota bacterium]